MRLPWLRSLRLLTCRAYDAGIRTMAATQSKRKEMSEEQLRLLVEGLCGYAVFMLDGAGRVANWNKGAKRMLGFTADAIVGEPFARLFPPEDDARHKPEEALRAAVADGRWEDEGWCVCADGSQLWTITVATTLRSKAGAVQGFSVIIQDITSRERLERGERQALLGLMSAKFAHEVRNPLSSIKMNVGLMRYEIEALSQTNPAAGTEARSLLQSIDSELRRIQRITQDYLKFARVSNSQRKPVVLNELLREKLAFLRPVFESHAISVETQFDETIAPLRIDGDQFWQVILNLVTNAVEAMQPGGTLTVSTAREGTDTVVKVADTGKGMSEEQRRKIFEPFFSTKKTGTGLGLPLTQQIVTENGGLIDCASELDKGTTFTIRFPQERPR